MFFQWDHILLGIVYTQLIHEGIEILEFFLSGKTITKCLVPSLEYHTFVLEII